MPVVRALRDGRGRDAEDADHRQNQAEQAEKRARGRDHAFLGEVAFHLLTQRPDFEEQTRVDTADGITNGGDRAR